MFNTNPQLRKLVYISAALLLVGTVGYILFVGWQNRDKTALIEIQSAVPNDANVTINGNKVGANSKNAVVPGKHTVSAKRNGFDDKTQEVEVKQGETKTVRLIMTPNGDEGYNWLRAHPDASMEYEGAVGQQFDQTSDKATAENPLIAYLPEVHPTWRVDYGKSVKNPNDPTALAIIITYGGSDIDKQNALDWIKSQGFKPEDYEIIYQTPPQPGDD